jgi:UDPglucose 6-dehydrogenase
MNRNAGQRIAIVGIGYVGLVTAIALAELGNDVHCLDIDANTIARLQAGHVPFYEPGVAEALANLQARMHFSTDVAAVLGNVDVAFVCVDTPPQPSGHADLSRVEAVIDSIPQDARLTLVMKSTVPVGTGERLQCRLRTGGHEHIQYVSNPEFLREGSALADVRRPDRVVIGADDDHAAALVANLWAAVECQVHTCDVASAEMIKLASNAFLATKISFINEIANVCDAVGADAEMVAAGMGLDHRIGGAFLRCGLRRIVLRQGRQRAEASCRQCRLPLPSPGQRARGERVATAASDVAPDRAPRFAAGQAHRRAWPRVQAGDR